MERQASTVRDKDKDSLERRRESTVDWPSEAGQYELGEVIGVGSGGTVFRARCIPLNRECAIKLVDLNKTDRWEHQWNEILTCSLIRHPNVLGHHCSFVREQELWIVMPLMDAGSCSSVMKLVYPNGIKDNGLLATILRETLEGLAYLHKGRIVHKDVKAENILLTTDGRVLLADLGVADTLMDSGVQEEKKATSFAGTPLFMAPEVVAQAGGYDTKADIWSFGITALELAYGSPPRANERQAVDSILSSRAALDRPPPTGADFNDESYNFSKSFHDMVAQCLQKDPAARPSAQALLQHRFFEHAKKPKYVVDNLISKLKKKQAQLNKQDKMTIKMGSAKRSPGK